MKLATRSQRYNDLFCQSLVLGFILLFEMSLIRVIYFLLARGSFEIVETQSLLLAFFVGLRFDALVLGFVFIPLVTVVAALVIIGFEEAKVSLGLKVYLSVSWGLIVLSSFWSLPYFLLKERHFRWQEDGKVFLWPQWSSLTEVVVIMIFMFILLSPMKSLWRRDLWKPTQWHHKESSSLGLVLLRLIMPVLIVAVTARGTVTPRHLERAHAEISVWNIVNELALNSVWSFDK